MALGHHSQSQLGFWLSHKTTTSFNENTYSRLIHKGPSVLKNNGFHNRHSPILRAFSPLSLFASGAPGAWYDPSDLTTLFQDSAGTTPVTAVEQPVGRILDKSGYGNHAFQATSASRPVLSARYNLLTKTEDFSDGVWTKASVTVTANATTAPDGTATADRIDFIAAVNARITQSVATQAASHLLKIWLKSDTPCTISLGNVLTNEVTVNVTTTWQEFTYTGTLPTGTSTPGLKNGEAVVKSVFAWGASLVPANQSTLPYQRVNTATDYNTTGFLPYLKFDGVDDSLSTNSISFTSTDKMSVFAGVRKLSDAAGGMLAELSASASTNNGSFYVSAPESTSNYGVRARGATGTGGYSPTTFTAPITNVVAAQLDLSPATVAAAVIPRINGAVNQTNIANVLPGGGNFGNYPLYIGRRNNATSPFNGQMYSMIIVGKAVTAGELSNTETFVATKTGVVLA